MRRAAARGAAGTREAAVAIGNPSFAENRGHTALLRLDALQLQIDPPNPEVRTNATATTRGGASSQLVGLYAVDSSGTPIDEFLAFGTFDLEGSFTVAAWVPSSYRGLTLTLIAFGIDANGNLVHSGEVATTFQ